METIFIFYKQNPKLLLQREKEGKKKKMERKKKGKPSAPILLHPFSNDARFIESKSEKEEKEK